MPAKAAMKKARSAPDAEFAAVFAGLRAVLAPYRSQQMRVTADTASEFHLETTFPVYRGKPVYFAGVKTGKGYVSFHFVPIYMQPELQKQLSPELKKHMQGKGCFNFKAVDANLFAEVGQLAGRGLELYRTMAANPGVIEKKLEAARKAHQSKSKAKR